MATPLLRFGIGSADVPRSIVWNIFAGESTIGGKRASDIYVAARPLAGVIKVSLHASGDWRLALTSERMNEVLDVKAGAALSVRLLHQWTKPEPKHHGLIAALRIVVPATELENFPPFIKPTTWVYEPKDGEYGEFSVWIAQNGLPEGSDTSARLKGVLKLPDLQVLLAYETHESSEAHVDGLAAARKEIAETAKTAGIGSPGDRGFTWFKHPQNDGSFALVEHRAEGKLKIE